MSDKPTADQRRWRVAGERGLIGITNGDHFYAADNLDGDLNILVWHFNDLESRLAAMTAERAQAAKDYLIAQETSERIHREELTEAQEQLAEAEADAEALASAIRDIREPTEHDRFPQDYYMITTPNGRHRAMEAALANHERRRAALDEREKHG